MTGYHLCSLMVQFCKPVECLSVDQCFVSWAFQKELRLSNYHFINLIWFWTLRCGTFALLWIEIRGVLRELGMIFLFILLFMPFYLWMGSFFSNKILLCMQLFFRFCSFCFFWFPFFYTPMLRDLPTLGNLSEEEFYDRIVWHSTQICSSIPDPQDPKHMLKKLQVEDFLLLNRPVFQELNKITWLVNQIINHVIAFL